MAKDETFATLTIKDAGEYSEDGRRIIATWLRNEADNLEAEGVNYAKRYRARYCLAAPKIDG